MKHPSLFHFVQLWYISVVSLSLSLPLFFVPGRVSPESGHYHSQGYTTLCSGSNVPSRFRLMFLGLLFFEGTWDKKKTLRTEDGKGSKFLSCSQSLPFVLLDQPEKTGYEVATTGTHRTATLKVGEELTSDLKWSWEWGGGGN